METKKCSKCKERKLTDAFSKDGSRSDGLHCYCKPCMSEYLAGHKEDKLKRFEEEVDLTCVVCSHLANPYHFHHVDPSTKRDREGLNRKMVVGDMLGSNYSWTAVKAEIDKCVVMCKGCHLLVEALIEKPDVLSHIETAIGWSLKTRVLK